MSSFNGDLGSLRWSIDADDSKLDAVLDRAEAKVRAWGARINSVVASPGSAGLPAVATFGGTSITGGNSFASPSTSQLVAAALPGIAPTTASRLSNEQWWAMQTQGFQSRLQSISLPAEAAATSFRGSSLYNFGAIALAGTLAAEAGRNFVHWSDTVRPIDRVLTTGSLQDQVTASIGLARSQDNGVLAWARNHSGRIGNLFEGITPGGAVDATEEAARTMQAQSASEKADRTSRRLAIDTSLVGARPFTQAAAGAFDDYQSTHDEVTALSRQARGLSGIAATNTIASASRLEQQAQSHLGSTLSYNGQAWLTHWAMYGMASGVNAFASSVKFAGQAGAAMIAATGDSFGASQAALSSQFAQEEAGQSNPLIRSAMWMAHTATLYANTQIHQRELALTAGSVKSLQYTLAGNPLAAQLASINAETANAIAGAGGIGTPAGQQVFQLGALRSQLANRDFLTQVGGMNISIAGERRVLGAMLDHNPIGAEATSIETSAIGQAWDLSRGGFGQQAAGILQNAKLREGLLKQDYLESFRAVSYDLRDSVINPRDTEDTGKVMDAMRQSLESIERMLQGMQLEG